MTAFSYVGKRMTKPDIYRKVTGSDLDATTQDILLEYSGGQGLIDDAATEGQS